METHTPRHHTALDSGPDPASAAVGPPLVPFVATAIPVGWTLLTIPLLTGLPDEPFILGTLLVGLVLPALVVTLRESGRPGLRALLRDAIRLPRPLIWLPVAAVALPVVVWTSGAVSGEAPPVTAASITGWVSALVSSFLIVNLAEETVWAGFVQRRAMAHRGMVRGSFVTALLFAGVHLPLAFDRAQSVADVAEGVAILLVTGVSLRLIIGCLDTWSGRSLFAIGLLHASYNSTADLAGTWTRLAVTVAFGALAVIVYQPQRRDR